MISAAIDTYLDNLAEYIFIDDKLVTYKWLSKELGLHVNLAKQILWQFWKEHDKGKDAFATFILMGYLAGGELRVEIVKEPDLPSAKRKFVKLRAEHLYSLQRALPDLELLALCGNGDHRKGAILCKEITPRTGEELRVLRWGSRINNKGLVEKSTATTELPQSKRTSNADCHPASKAKEIGSANFFRSDANAKKGSMKSSTFVTQNITATAAAAAAAKSSIDNKSTARARGRKRQGSKERERSNKRVRLDAADGSWSSEESGDNEESETDNYEMLCSPEVAIPSKNIAGSKSPNSPAEYKIENGKNMVRKIVDKISLDDNGYLVTEKEYIYESSSDKDEKSTASKAEPPKPRAEAKSKRTQASLLNFFKNS